MKRVMNFVKGKKCEKREKICVQITNPLGQKVPSEDEHVIGLQSGYGYEIDLNGRDKYLTKLHKAAWQGNVEKVKLHLKKYEMNVVDEFNRTPLHLAAAQGHMGVVSFLLSNNDINIEICDNHGMTPFLKALECGVKECASLLLERGANIFAADNNGNTALHICSKQGFFNIMSMLLKTGVNCDSTNNAGEMPLHIATEQEHRDLVERLLQAGAHVNVVDRDNRTPLMLAARVGEASIISLLLKFGANLDACDNNGWTAEDYAVIGGHEQLALELKVPSNYSVAFEPVRTNQSNCLESAHQQQEIFTNAGHVEHIVEVIENRVNNTNSEPVIRSPPYNALMTEEEAQDSPRSCVTPPPLNPPRSWEIIQAGMIDQTQVRRRSLMALGTLESHRNSFLENGNDYENQPRAESNVKMDGARGDSDSEWGSDDSLPLDRSLPPPPDGPSSLESNLAPPDLTIREPEVVVTPDRRSRVFLERTTSLDLTDSECINTNRVPVVLREEAVIGSEDISESNMPVYAFTELVDNINLEKVNVSINDTGQLKPTQSIFADSGEKNINDKPTVIVAMDGNFNKVQNENDNLQLGSYLLDNLDDNAYKSGEVDTSQSCAWTSTDQLSGAHSLDTETSMNEPELVQSLDSLEEESLAVGTVVKRRAFPESHSLELLDKTNDQSSHHAQRISISGSSHVWSKSVDYLSRPCMSDSLCVDRKHIDAQLKCYDEALRELAEEQQVKEDLFNLAVGGIRSSKCNLNYSTSYGLLEENTSSSSNVNIEPDLSDSQKGQMTFQTQSRATLDEQNVLKVSKEEDVSYLKNSPTTGMTCINGDMNSTHKTDLTIDSPVGAQEFHEVQTHTYNHKNNVMSNVSAFNLSRSILNQTGCSSASSPIENVTLDSKLKSYNSLELPPKNKSKCQQNGFNCTCPTDLSHTMNMSTDSNAKLTKPVPLEGISANRSSKKFYDRPEAPQQRAKYIKKQSSFAYARRCEEKPRKKRVRRSVSLFEECFKNEGIEKSANEIENNERFFSERSESDSEWSERSVQNKRKQFVAMRGVAAGSDDSNKEIPPFCLSTGKEGGITRRDTVIYNQHATNSETKSDSIEEQSGDGNDELDRSDSVSMRISQSTASSPHPYKLEIHHSLLKGQASEERASLEEITKFKDQTQRLQYDLADAKQVIIVRDDTLVILQDELARLSGKYSTTQEELNNLKTRLTAAEIELKHLRDFTTMKYENEYCKPDLSTRHSIGGELHDAIEAKMKAEAEKEALMAQHIMDIKKLQQDTIYWKSLYEDAVSKLEQLEGLCDPLMENNQHFDEVKFIFKQFREDKGNDPCKTQIIVATLQTQLQQEKTKTAALETQIQKMLLELQVKLDLEAELENLNHRLKKEFVPRLEMEQLRANQEMAVGRIRQQALIESETKLNAKLTEINQILQLQLQDQMQRDRQRETMEAQMKQEFENTRQKLLLELSRVQAALCAKESDERSLRTRCEALTRNAEMSQELKHQHLIEKSYSVNLAKPNISQEKDLTVKQCVVPSPPPVHAHSPTLLDHNMFSANSLRQQLERSISKHRDIQLDSEDHLSSPHGQ